MGNMKLQMKMKMSLLFAVVAVSFVFGGTVFSAEPLKVFILAGQSNMQGQGEITKEGRQGTLEYVVDNDTDGTYAHLVDGDGNWVVRDDVWVYYERDGSTTIKSGLTAGFGVKSTTIGPELQFGHVIGDYYDEPVLIIKTAWGGKSLAIDFRSPSSGDINDEITFDPPKTAEEQGYYYREMIAVVNAFKAAPQSYYPAYNAADSYEIVGFGWHQGWNDRVKEEFVAQYERNMKHFIDDVRNDMGIPNLPFVIATTGMRGWYDMTDKAIQLVEAQLAMEDFAKYPEFEGNVAVVDTRDFWRESEVSPANQGYHWNRNAETYFLIGNAMAEELTGIIDPNAPSVNAGIDMIAWSGQVVVLDPNIVEKAGSDWTALTYLWTAEPNGIGDPDLDVAITDADTENASVTITKTAPTGDATVVTMTLAVNAESREGEDPVTDFMTIDVYDDACTAAIGKGLAADNPTDFNENCITDFGDVAMLAAKWLTDHAFTEPVAK